jgi:hypothetical protein
VELQLAQTYKQLNMPVKATSTLPPFSFFSAACSFMALPEAYKVMDSPANKETHN